MRIRRLDIGVESITRWDAEDEVHLPREGSPAPQYIPQYQHLDEILRRPSLDERLPRLLQPATVDPDLLAPAVLSDTRLAARDLFRGHAHRGDARHRGLFEAAARVLDDDRGLDEEVRRALATLLRG